MAEPHYFTIQDESGYRGVYATRDEAAHARRVEYGNRALAHAIIRVTGKPRQNVVLLGESVGGARSDEIQRRADELNAESLEIARRAEETAQYLSEHPRCTARVDDLGYLSHDGPTCPIHESGDVDRGDEQQQPKQSAGTVELADGTELAVRLGDPIVFDPTGRDLIRCAVVGIVIDCDEEAQEPGEQPAPIVRVNDIDDDTTGQLVVVRRAFAVLTAEGA